MVNAFEEHRPLGVSKVAEKEPEFDGRPTWALPPGHISTGTDCSMRAPLSQVPFVLRSTVQAWCPVQCQGVVLGGFARLGESPPWSLTGTRSHWLAAPARSTKAPPLPPRK